MLVCPVGNRASRLFAKFECSLGERRHQIDENAHYDGHDHEEEEVLE
jgi:hypothetical protein